jgi:hypothetical protein
MSDFSAYKRPSSIGAGVWYTMHLMSFNLETEDDIISLYNLILLLLRKFQCTTCRGHFNDFAKINNPQIAMKNDIKDFKKKIKPENLAKWLVKAHNGATKHKFNTLSEKTGHTFNPMEMSYEDVKNFFTRPQKEEDKSSKSEKSVPKKSSKSGKVSKEEEEEENDFEPCQGDCDSDEEEETFVTKVTDLEENNNNNNVYKTKTGSSIRLSPRKTTVTKINNNPQFKFKIVPTDN